jgi:hypothetical protein
LFEKIEMQEFSNFINTFPKFSQNFSFHFRELRRKKKSVQITYRITKKNWLVYENPWFQPLAGWQILTQFFTFFIFCMIKNPQNIKKLAA